MAGVHCQRELAFKGTGQFFPVPTVVKIPDQICHLIAEPEGSAILRIFLQRKGYRPQQGISLGIQGDVCLVQRLTICSGGHLAAKVIEVLQNLRRSSLHGEGEVGVFPLAVGFVQDQGKPLGVLGGCQGVHLSHFFIGSHIGAHSGFPLIVQSECLADQG